MDRCGGSLGICSGNKHIVKLGTQLYLMAWWLGRQTVDVKPLLMPRFESPEMPYQFPFIATKIVCGNNGEERSQGYAWGVSAVSCRMNKIEGVETL